MPRYHMKDKRKKKKKEKKAAIFLLIPLGMKFLPFSTAKLKYIGHSVGQRVSGLLLFIHYLYLVQGLSERKEKEKSLSLMELSASIN